jgi:serine/threonine protein phosphatase 1
VGRILAIGDIHGCFDALLTLTAFVDIKDDDTIITLGDYVDRGPNTRAVIDWLLQMDDTHTLIPLRGNHEVMMLSALENDAHLDSWLFNGGDTALDSYSPIEGEPGRLTDIPDRHWRFLNDRLHAYYETETHFFVHANAYSDIPLDEQPDFMLYWDKFDDPPRHQSGKIMVCGHTSQKSGKPIANENAVCLDSRVYGTGWLTCLDAESGQIYQGHTSGETRTMRLDAIGM